MILREKRFRVIFGKHINRYYLRYAGLILLGLLSLAVVDIAQLKVPEYYRMVVNGMNSGYVETDGVNAAFDMDFLLDKVCLPLIIVILFIVAGRFLWRVCLFGSAIRVETDLRDRMFDHCKNLSQQYYQVNKVGNMMSLFTNDLETVQDCFGSGILMFFDAAFLGVLALIKMLRMNLSLSLWALIPMFFLFGIGLLMSKVMSKRWEQRQAAFSRLSDFAQESFSGIAVIKAFVKEYKEYKAFTKLNKENEKINVEFTKIETLLQVLITLAVESIVCVILGYGGYLVYSGVFNAGQMIEFIGYFTAIVWPIEAIAMLLEMNARGKASLKRISELLDAPVDVRDREDVSDVEDIAGRIEFRNLNFTYPGSSVEVLHDVSFTIEAGENIGIIGRTGSGKTTIVDLIMRTYNVPDGVLFVDDRDVNSLPMARLRSHIAYVPQDNFLFSDTIRNNIAFAFEEGGDMKDVEEAARRADVHDNIVEFQDGYETVLGERGVTVSGGQKQRISIARALMKKAAILILDDSVSAVDTGTEKVIIDALKESRKGKTTLMIAHRISTVEQMDRILFVDEGRILDFGTHEELLTRCREYADMVRLQQLEDEKEGEKHV